MIQSYQANYDMSYHISVHCHGKCLVEYMIISCGSAYCSIWHVFGNKYYGHLDQYNFLLIKRLQEGRIELEVLTILLSGGLIYGLCHIVTTLGKCYIVHASKNLNDSKVKSLSKMMSKDININLHRQ